MGKNKGSSAQAQVAASGKFDPRTATREELAKFIGDKVHESFTQVLAEATDAADDIDFFTGQDYTAEDVMRDAIKHVPVLGGDGRESELDG